MDVSVIQTPTSEPFKGPGVRDGGNNEDRNFS